MYFTVAARHLRKDLWHNREQTAILIAASACYDRKRKRLRVYQVPQQARPLFADSGGFVFANEFGEYPFTLEDYVEWVRKMRPQFAAVMDYPCEQEVAANDEMVKERQRKTLENARHLMKIKIKGTRWVPVIQGRTIEQYREHARAYKAAGLVRKYMGIGSLCRRTRASEISAIVAAVAEELPGVKFHLFGVKLQIFKQREALHSAVASADTGAWNGRFGTDIQKFNRVMQEREWSQAVTEMDWALPSYAAKIEKAVTAPKQRRMVDAAYTTKHTVRFDLLSSPLIYDCDCGSYLTLEQMLEMEEDAIDDLFALLKNSVCPVCLDQVLEVYDYDLPREAPIAHQATFL